MSAVKQDVDEYEEEDLLIFVEIDGLVATEALDVNTTAEPFFKIMGLDTDTPFMQIGNEYFTGEHTEAIGSTLFFEADDDSPSKGKRPAETRLRYFGKTCKHVSMRRAFLHKKNQSEAESVPRPSYLDDELMATLPDSVISDYLSEQQREARRGVPGSFSSKDNSVEVTCHAPWQSSTEARDVSTDVCVDESIPGPSSAV